eukprot:3650564-Prymnesium_polylepis.1
MLLSTATHARKFDIVGSWPPGVWVPCTAERRARVRAPCVRGVEPSYVDPHTPRTHDLSEQVKPYYVPLTGRVMCGRRARGARASSARPLRRCRREFQGSRFNVHALRVCTRVVEGVECGENLGPRRMRCSHTCFVVNT